MKSKPLYFDLVSLFCLLLIVSMPMQVAHIYEYQFKEFYLLFDKLTFLNWSLIGIYALNSYLSHNAHPWLKYTIPASVVLTAINNIFVSWLGEDLSFIETTLATLFYTVVMSGHYYGDNYTILKHPEKCWWRTQKRVKRNLPIRISHRKDEMQGLSFDISKSGMFIEEDHLLKINSLKIGDTINLLIKLPFTTIECKAVITRKARASGKYPAGIGVEFIEVPDKFDEFIEGHIYKEEDIYKIAQ